MKRTFHILSILVALSFFVPTLASAEAERLILKYKDRHIQSKNHQVQALYLKRELKQRYPQLNLNQYRLVRTVVMAKSKKGKGTIQLRVRNNYSRKHKVHGPPQGFGNSAKFTYDKIEIGNPAHRSDGPWQLLFTGNFKLRKVLLVVERKDRNKNTHYSSNDNTWWDSNHRPYDYADDWNRDRYQNSHNARNYLVPLPLVLPARNWGTDMEGEKQCGKRSGKVADGWRYPNTICEASSSATFRGGYRPVRLFIRPDSRPLDIYNNLRIRNLQVSLTLDNHGKRNSATIGINIGGREYTKYIDCTSSNRNREASFSITGDWNPADVQNSRFWILPEHGNSELTIKHMQVRVKKIG
ncbi:hypothetical protein [Desulfopila sp. IMCC35008]|uniref:hypothetical protein n=1 Tax=Desulfopila sp. IMCC35008 TaxID=2653858 RepID=UPI0013D26DD6|nr:hypothetical protein [Desulfopila sp. IMCC35008]